MKNNLNRRSFIGLGAGAVWLMSNPISKAVAAVCGFTPPQTAGPFYPGEAQFQNDNDLTQKGSALGEVIIVKGVVQDAFCNPIANANVEIWQACSSGKYNNPNDPNPAPLDPGFKYWGETYTGLKGEYVFKTIIPGAYPATDDWTRPAHIHFKITKLGFKDLITQMYFNGDPYNSGDKILKAIPASERNSVITEFKEDPVLGVRAGEFNITLKAIN